MTAGRRIYFDHAATAWPKSDVIDAAAMRYSSECGAAAGRGAYASAIEASAILASVRRHLARMIHAPSPSDISLHPSGTAAINHALHGMLRQGDHVVTTAVEHNSVLRPLHFLRQQGTIDVTFVDCDSDGKVAAPDVLQAVTKRTRMVAVTHASNVTGAVQPVQQIGAGLRTHPAHLFCDAAQSFGYLPIDVVSWGIDLLASPGHKGGHGPLGTGFLYAAASCQAQLRPLIQGGTGTHSESLEMPDRYPEKLEAGNLNVPALAGWSAGLAAATAGKSDAPKLQDFATRLHEGLRQITGIRLIGSPSSLPVVSLTADGLSPTDLSAILDAEYQIETRAGLHCAALVHKFLGSSPEGTLRISAGRTTSVDEIEQLFSALRNVVGQSLS